MATHVHRTCISVESIMTPSQKYRVAYLGPPGTFTEEALLAQADLAEMDLIPLPSIDAVLEAVTVGGAEFGFVPIENSIEGTVSATIDSLIFDHQLLIIREVISDIHLHLLGIPGTTLAQIEQVWSYPHALAQCRKFTALQIPNAELKASNSTAEAAMLVKEANLTSIAAIAPRVAAKIYQLESLEENIEDHQGNQTRFLVVGKDVIPAPSANDKTAIVCFQLSDQPGSLFSILAEFSARNLNLSKLESRPSKKGLGEYCFVIEFEGHIANHVVADTLVALKRKLADIKFLGSFPKFDDTLTPAERILDGDDPASQWVAQIRRQISGMAD